MSADTDPPRLGYACINTRLREQGIHNSRSAIQDTIRKKRAAGVRHLQQLALSNIRDLLAILQWNERAGIRLFRVSSNLFPHMGNAMSSHAYYHGDIDFAREALRAVGDFARAHNHRLTFHSQPFTQLGTPDAAVLARSVFDLRMYAEIIHAMGLQNHDACVILHGGGVYADAVPAAQRAEARRSAKRDTLQRWVANYQRLPARVRRFIVLENDEWHYGVADLLPLCERHTIPMVFDAFHNAISAESVPVTPQLLQRITRVWHAAGYRRAKFHVSEQDPKLRFGSHAAMVKALPEYLLRAGYDIMIEAKNKERAVERLLRQYFEKTIVHDAAGKARCEWRLRA